MKRLPYINLLDRYSSYDISKDDKNPHIVNHTSRELLSLLTEEDNSRSFVRRVMALTQLYINGLIDQNSSSSINRGVQKEILDDLFFVGRESIASFYRCESMDFEEMRYLLLKHKENLVKYSSRNNVRDGRLNGEYTLIQNFGLELQDKIYYLDLPDTIVYVASGALEPALLAMDILEKNNLVPLRYSRFVCEDIEVKSPLTMTEDHLKLHLNEKRVIVIEDKIDTGESLVRVMNYVADFGPTKLYGFALCAEGCTEYNIEQGLAKRASEEIKIINNSKPYIFEYCL